MKQKKQKYKPVRVYSTFDEAQVTLAKIALEKEGIQFETIDESFATVNRMNPFTPGTGAIDIMVDEKDVERARGVLKHLFEKEK